MFLDMVSFSPVYLGPGRGKNKFEFFPWLPMLSVHIDGLWYKKSESLDCSSHVNISAVCRPVLIFTICAQIVCGRHGRMIDCPKKMEGLRSVGLVFGQCHSTIAYIYKHVKLELSVDVTFINFCVVLLLSPYICIRDVPFLVGNSLWDCLQVPYGSQAMNHQAMVHSALEMAS